MDQLSAYDYDLPAELLATRPEAQRDASRLMIVNRADGAIRHETFANIGEHLRATDHLVFNNTRVLPARLFGIREATGGKWEGLFLNADTNGRWTLIGETRGKLQPGEWLVIHPAYQPDAADRLRLQLLERDTDGMWFAQPESNAAFVDLLNQFGTLPLPPYIGRKLADEQDQTRYQTVYNSVPGAVAAPTAGLHFTDPLLNDLTSRGITRHEVTLHVGIGTFRPVAVEQLDDHQMHGEWCEVSAKSATALAEARAVGQRIVAVGTTTVRTLESAARCGQVTPFAGETDLFIRPGFDFHAIEGLLTNFHLPRSTLLVLVAAFAGYDLMREAYRQAVQERYRFYSYGDAMLIV